MTTTHPDTTPTPVEVVPPPSLGDLALALTAVHAAATAGDLDGYTTALQQLDGHTRTCLRAVGARFECDACDRPLNLDQLTTATPLPPRVPVKPRTAAAQAYRLRVAAHLVTLFPDVELAIYDWQRFDDVSVTVNRSDNDQRRAAELKLAGFRKLHAPLGGGPVDVRVQPDGTMHLGLDGQFGDIKIDASVILRPVGTVQDDARAWAATTQPASTSS